MNQGTTVLAQIIAFVDYESFRSCVRRYDGDRRVRDLSCWEQFLAMAFAQLTHRESLRDIEVSLAAHRRKLYHSGFRSSVKRSTLADANEGRDWRIYADFAQSLIQIARPLYAETDLGLDLKATVYALDATTIDLCLSLFPWASFRRAKGAVKLHTMIDLQGSIPVFIDITHGKVGDVDVLDQIVPQPGSYIVMDRGYMDFQRLYYLHQALGFFIIRAKADLQFQRRRSHAIDKSTGLRSDQTIVLTGPKSSRRYPEALRRIGYYSQEIDKRFVFLTNAFSLPALTVAAIYRYRWQIELFFKWIKQHLRIKRFFGTSPNGVKTQIWIAVAVYVLIAIVKKRLGLGHSLYTILQVLSTTLFEKTPVPLVFQRFDEAIQNIDGSKQLMLFDI
ncbi:MAG: IS4 family transposase [Ignavibacteria bacterium]|nr:IS4 family transposase [Ignavibacteria bacterium]